MFRSLWQKRSNYHALLKCVSEPNSPLQSSRGSPSLPALAVEGVPTYLQGDMARIEAWSERPLSQGLSPYQLVTVRSSWWGETLYPFHVPGAAVGSEGPCTPFPTASTPGLCCGIAWPGRGSFPPPKLNSGTLCLSSAGGQSTAPLGRAAITY